MKFELTGLGDCEKCFKPIVTESDGVKVFVKFDEPLPAMPELGIEECVGVYVFQHTTCARKNLKR